MKAGGDSPASVGEGLDNKRSWLSSTGSGFGGGMMERPTTAAS